MLGENENDGYTIGEVVCPMKSFWAEVVFRPSWPLHTYLDQFSWAGRQFMATIIQRWERSTWELPSYSAIPQSGQPASQTSFPIISFCHASSSMIITTALNSGAAVVQSRLYAYVFCVCRHVCYSYWLLQHEEEKKYIDLYLEWMSNWLLATRDHNISFKYTSH